jgi:threonyl-tRNA synthetase
MTSRIQRRFFYSRRSRQAIEKRMAELAKKDEVVTRKVVPRDEAIAYFEGH